MNMIKIRVVQAIIQIERPVNWSLENVRKLAIEIKMIEVYNSVATGKFDKVRKKWEKIR